MPLREPLHRSCWLGDHTPRSSFVFFSLLFLFLSNDRPSSRHNTNTGNTRGHSILWLVNCAAGKATIPPCTCGLANMHFSYSGRSDPTKIGWPASQEEIWSVYNTTKKDSLPRKNSGLDKPAGRGGNYCIYMPVYTPIFLVL